MTVTVIVTSDGYLAEVSAAAAAAAVHITTDWYFLIIWQLSRLWGLAFSTQRYLTETQAFWTHNCHHHHHRLYYKACQDLLQISQNRDVPQLQPYHNSGAYVPASLQRPRFSPRPVHVKLVLDKVACFFPSTAVIPCQYHTISTPYWFVHLSLVLLNLSKWHHHWITQLLYYCRDLPKLPVPLDIYFRIHFRSLSVYTVQFLL